MAGITSLTNVTSGAIANAEKAYSKVYNPVESKNEYENTFTQALNKALDNINTTNSYLSDAENEEIKWALGEADNTHDLTVALQKASTALQYTVQVRDRILNAYNQLMQMQF